MRHWQSFDRICELMETYLREFTAHRDDPKRLNAHVAQPLLGLSIHVHVADTDEKAMEQARPAYAAFYENFTRRYLDLGSDKYPRQEDFDRLVAVGKVAVGSPETVGRLLGDLCERSGANYLIGSFTFGSLSYEQSHRSLELFAREVMPVLAAAGVPA